MSYRIPSMHEIDYYKAMASSSDKKSIDQPGRNDPCPCGAVESISIAVVFVINNTLSILFYASSSELASISNVTKT